MNDMLVDLALILNPWADQRDAKLLGQNGLLKRKVQGTSHALSFKASIIIMCRS